LSGIPLIYLSLKLSLGDNLYLYSLAENMCSFQELNRVRNCRSAFEKSAVNFDKLPVFFLLSLMVSFFLDHDYGIAIIFGDLLALEGDFATSDMLIITLSMHHVIKPVIHLKKRTHLDNGSA